jgi:hypothetical protein
MGLDGFTYDQLVGDEPKSVEKRLKWLGGQKRYHSQPFEQLTAMYRKLGDSASGADVAIFRWRTRRREMPPRHFAARGWDLFLDISSGYGYRPWRPHADLIVLIILGTIIYAWADRNHAFCPADSFRSWPPCVTPPKYPPFSPLAYSIETLLPFGDFGQRRFYVLSGSHWQSDFVSIYTLVHRFLGWMFSLLLALAPTNILRRE